ncbi:MAG: MCE family protein [Pseudonocardiaceae bacterium]|nr:MCE family protein [Pseudonocardiaceae bacterium]
MVGVLWWIFFTEDKRITAYFDRAVGVYTGSDVRVLGVAIGQVESVTPRGEQVEIGLTVDPEVPIPADATVVIVSPSVVADRYVQFPVYRTGEQLADGAVIPAERTATPVELDELYASLNELTTALGPKGANSEGALSDLLDTGAENLRGNGKAFNDMVRDFANMARTLADSKDDLFGTIDELQKFTTMLANNDDQVRKVNQQMASVWRTLSADRDELSSALHSLGKALGEIQGFIKDNRARIKSNVDKLAKTTQQLVSQRGSVAEALDVAPLGVTNALNSFDPRSGSLQGRTNLLEYLDSWKQASAGQTAIPQGSPIPESAPRLPLPTAGSTYVPNGSTERGGN